MTREEAIARACNVDDGFSYTVFVDRLVALGLLKLEEPKCAERRLLDGFAKHGVVFSRALLRDALDNANLTIVEKQHGE